MTGTFIIHYLNMYVSSYTADVICVPKQAPKYTLYCNTRVLVMGYFDYPVTLLDF